MDRWVREKKSKPALWGLSGRDLGVGTGVDRGGMGAPHTAAGWARVLNIILYPGNTIYIAGERRSGAERHGGALGNGAASSGERERTGGAGKDRADGVSKETAKEIVGGWGA